MHERNKGEFDRFMVSLRKIHALAATYGLRFVQGALYQNRV